jgi:PAS domain S-box-containing protein
LLNERIKELTTLYKASQLLRDEEISAEQLLNKLLEILPPGWQYPEITEARIMLDGREFYTPGFQRSIDKQSVEFTVYDSITGILEVGYTEKMKDEDEGPFLAEERKLIVMLAEMLGNYFVRKRATAQLIKEKELSESIINTLPGIFYLFDTEGNYLRWNKNHETVTGYSSNEMTGMHPLNFFKVEEQELIKERIGKVFENGDATVEANFLVKDGSTIPYLFNGVKIEYEGKPAIMGVGFDITERKKAFRLHYQYPTWGLLYFR